MHLPHSRLAILIALAASLVGCRETVSPVTDDITVTPVAEGLEILNTTSEPIYSMELDSGTLALIYFEFCSPRCPIQQPAERRLVPWSSILGYSKDRFEYLVLWAH